VIAEGGFVMESDAKVQKIDKVKYGQRVRAARESKKMSSEQLAELVGVTPQTISMIENGHKSTSLSLLTRICNELMVSPEFILGNELKPGISKYANDRLVEHLLLSSTDAEKEMLLDIAKTIQSNRAKYEVK